MLGGDTLFYVFISIIVSCFSCATLAIDLNYEFIHAFMCLLKCFRNIQVYSDVLLSTLATDR